MKDIYALLISNTFSGILLIWLYPIVGLIGAILVATICDVYAIKTIGRR